MSSDVDSAKFSRLLRHGLTHIPYGVSLQTMHAKCELFPKVYLTRSCANRKPNVRVCFSSFYSENAKIRNIFVRRRKNATQKLAAKLY